MVVNLEKTPEEYAKMMSDYTTELLAEFNKGCNFTQKQQREDAINSFLHSAWCGLQIVYVYEALGRAAKNPKFNYPHYIIYQLETYLQGGLKETKTKDGIVNAPVDRKGSEVLSLASILAKIEKKDGILFLSPELQQQQDPKLDYESIDIDKTFQSAKKIIDFLVEKDIITIK